MRFVVVATFVAAAAAFRPAAHTSPMCSSYSRDVWNPWAVSSQAPERQLIGAEHVAPSVAKVHAAESSPSSKRARINKLKLAEPLGSVFDSDSTEVHGVSTEAATSPLSPQRLAEIEAKALADAMAASRRRRARAAP